MTKYKIIRFYKDKNKDSKTLKRGVTLKEAQSHCSDPKTRKEGVFFDGYEEDIVGPTATYLYTKKSTGVKKCTECGQRILC